MQFQGTERTQQIKPAPPPIDLNSGRLDIIRATLAGAFVIVSLLVAALGIAIVIYFDSAVVVVLGMGIAIVGILLGGVVLYVSITEWLDHRVRVREWHEAAITTYEALRGAEQVEQVSEWELSASNPAHVLIAALWVHLRRQEGENNAYTVRKLGSPIFLGSRRVGNLTKMKAEIMAQQFQRLGLIEGRREGYSGIWVPETADQIVDMVVKRWR
jgi:hypothetical protein